MHDDSDRVIYEKIVQFVNLENRRLLEVGCGDGRITKWLAGKSALLTAIDPDAQGIEEARNAISGVDFRIGSGEALTFQDASFDLVIFTLSLHHHQNPWSAISEATRVLDPDGRILVIEPTEDGDLEKIFALFNDETQDTAAAQRAIQDSDLRLEKEEHFSADWIFEDETALYEAAFSFYDKPFDPQVARQISDLLSEKLKSRPIVLEDTMVIQSLKKS